MKLYPDCDYFPDGYEECYRWEICITSFMKDKTPIHIDQLINFVGR